MEPSPEPPRRYQVRWLHDVQRMTQAEIAEHFGIGQGTVSKDLAQTVAPAGYTEAGTPFYPPGRFDSDPEYRERVEQLCKQMPRLVAKRAAAEEFAAKPPGFEVKRDEWRTPEERDEILTEFGRLL